MFINIDIKPETVFIVSQLYGEHEYITGTLDVKGTDSWCLNMQRKQCKIDCNS